MGSEHATLNQGAARGRVDLQHPVEMPQVDADAAGVAVAYIRLDAAHHRRAATERNRGGAPVGAPGEDVLHLVLVTRIGDHVGSIPEVTANAADQIVVRLA